jgi:hypothetical protein
MVKGLCCLAREKLCCGARLIDISTCYGMENNVDKTTIPTTDKDRSKKLKSEE